ncbi:MAG: hypothetical protein K0Q50_223 [Vampirovibrio sp.]|jgi:hypothetical protein|nr:hypothetical protein [Vampirovibrio sp.]
MASRAVDKMECHYPAHNTPGKCGKCNKRFGYTHPMQYFCENCRSLPISDWIDWMERLNKIAIRKRLEAKAALLKQSSGSWG